MLGDLLATVLGFIVVILLLSLVVTGLTQLITASLRLRVNNLRRALTILINDLGGGGAKKSELLPRVNNTITAANFGTTRAPADMIAGLGLIRSSWIEAEDLIPSLKAAGVSLTDEQAQKAKHSFSLLENYMNKRFALFARYISFGMAFAVAIAFQVSAPELLRQLGENADLRARYAAVASSLQSPDANKIREAALEGFEAKGNTRAAEATSSLAALDIMPWRKGLDFYRGSGCLGLNWDRVFGILLTALLLTFGASFWFDRLKDVAHLRDTVTRQETKRSGSQTE